MLALSGCLISRRLKPAREPAYTMSENSAEKYRQRAAQCLSLAERAEREEDRATWLELAGKWQRLAEEAGRNPVAQQAQ
ncbi:MAG: hypothetical protein QOI46_6456 [Alphaproteobacteria bacterium]|nr:hypothetical protein [Alphaproteobacteria bacterium]